MTSNRNLLILIAIAAAMAALTAALYSGKHSSASEFQPGVLLVQGLDPQKVETISIVKGVDAVTLNRRESGFVVAERNDYPASTGRINDLLLNCMDVRCKSKITDDKAHHKDLGVVEGGDDTVSVRFTGKDENGKEKMLIGLIRGGSSDGGLPFVRLVGEDTVYSAEGRLDIATLPMRYIDTKLFEVKQEDIRRVTVKAGADSYSIARDEKGAATLSPVPAGKRAKDSMRDTVLNALTRLDFTDVKPAEKMTLEWDATYTCELANKLVYTVKLAKKDGKDYAAVSAFAPDVGRVAITRNESDEELKKKEAAIVAASTAGDFTPRHAPWVYELSSYQAEKLRHPLNDLVEEIPTGPEEVAASHILIGYQGADRSQAARTKDEARKLAGEVLAKAQTPDADFAALARQYSDDPGSKENGGDLGAFKKGAMTKAFEDAAWALDVGGISDVVETPFGFHIIKRTK